jgi:DNA relaxase NicK
LGDADADSTWLRFELRFEEVHPVISDRYI